MPDIKINNAQKKRKYKNGNKTKKYINDLMIRQNVIKL